MSLSKQARELADAIYFKKCDEISKEHKKELDRIYQQPNSYGNFSGMMEQYVDYLTKLLNARTQAYRQAAKKDGRSISEGDNEEIISSLTRIMNSVLRQDFAWDSPYSGIPPGSNLPKRMTELLTHRCHEVLGSAAQELRIDMEETALERKQKERYLVLMTLYRIKDKPPVSIHEVSQETGLSESVVLEAADYLAEEGLIEQMGNESPAMRIKHLGIVEAEGSIANQQMPPQHSFSIASMSIPPEIRESLAKFQKDNPDPSKTAFILMRFSKSKAHDEIAQVIKDALSLLGIKALRADDKEYHDDLFPNVLTYIYGCGFGIAVFERIKTEDFNPNVSLEVGYMMGLRKQVCLLKDETVKELQSDLVGKLYRPFDPQDIAKTIPEQLSKWLSDKSLI